jgi:hypothetical protein
MEREYLKKIYPYDEFYGADIQIPGRFSKSRLLILVFRSHPLIPYKFLVCSLDFCISWRCYSVHSTCRKVVATCMLLSPLIHRYSTSL